MRTRIYVQKTILTTTNRCSSIMVIVKVENTALPFNFSKYS